MQNKRLSVRLSVDDIQDWCCDNWDLYASMPVLDDQDEYRTTNLRFWVKVGEERYKVTIGGSRVIYVGPSLKEAVEVFNIRR